MRRLFSKLQRNSLAFIAGLKGLLMRVYLPEIAHYSPYCFHSNIHTASKGYKRFILFHSGVITTNVDVLPYARLLVP